MRRFGIVILGLSAAGGSEREGDGEVQASQQNACAVRDRKDHETTVGRWVRIESLDGIIRQSPVVRNAAPAALSRETDENRTADKTGASRL